MIDVLIIEDDDDIRQALELLIAGTAGFECAGSNRSCEDALSGLDETMPDVVLMDINLPGISGIAGVREIKARVPECEILMLTNYEEESLVFDALCSGAAGYLLKTTPPAKLLDGIREVHQGGAPMSATIARLVVKSFQRSTTTLLTRRETEILSHLCQGKSYKMIADALFISQGTVHSHIKNIYSKLKVNSKSEAVIKALHERLV